MSGLIMELVARAHLEWKRRVTRNLLPYGTNPKQVYVLRKLRESPLVPSEIALLVRADRPTVTSLLGTLERAGWISRRRDPENGKRVLVKITPQGRKFLESIPESLWRSGKTGFDPEACFTGAERAELIRLLRKLDQWIESNR